MNSISFVYGTWTESVMYFLQNKRRQFIAHSGPSFSRFHETINAYTLVYDSRNVLERANMRGMIIKLHHIKFKFIVFNNSQLKSR